MNRLLAQLLFLLLSAAHAFALEPCSGSSNEQACVGLYQLSWKGYSAYDAASDHYHLIALTNIADVFTNEPTGYRVPTIKELLTLMRHDGQTFATVNSWLVGSGYLISSTHGASVAGVYKIMAIDIETKEVVALDLNSTGSSYYLIATHRAGEVVNN